MQLKKYIIVKAGPRCGSNLVVQHFVNQYYSRLDTPDYLEAYNNSLNCYIGNFDDFNRKVFKKALKSNLVIHDHTINYFLPSALLDESMIINVKRRNEFNQLMSQMVIYRLQKEKKVQKFLKKNGLDLFYPKKDFTDRLPKLTLEKSFFDLVLKEFYRDNKHREQAIIDSNLECYTIYFEDFVENKDFFSNNFSTQTIVPKKIDVFQKTPIQSKDIFINFSEICMWWEHRNI